MDPKHEDPNPTGTASSPDSPSLPASTKRLAVLRVGAQPWHPRTSGQARTRALQQEEVAATGRLLTPLSTGWWLLTFMGLRRPSE